MADEQWFMHVGPMPASIPRGDGTSVVVPSRGRVRILSSSKTVERMVAAGLLKQVPAPVVEAVPAPAPAIEIAPIAQVVVEAPIVEEPVAAKKIEVQAKKIEAPEAVPAAPAPAEPDQTDGQKPSKRNK